MLYAFKLLYRTVKNNSHLPTVKLKHKFLFKKDIATYLHSYIHIILKVHCHDFCYIGIQ